MSRWWLLGCALGLCACKFGSPEAHDSPGDPPADAGPPSTLGSGSRIDQVIEQYAHPDSGVPYSSASTSGVNVYITGSAIVTIDDYDETHDGKSIGAVYVQDVVNGPSPPYSGIQLYKPTYSPANLIVTPGDVVDMTGLYQNYQYSGSSGGFAKDTFYPELSEPVVSLRFVYDVPPPTPIDPNDISATVAASPDPKVFNQGVQWASILVEIDDVTLLTSYTDSAGRVTVYFSTPTFPNGVAESDTGFANQLYDLDPDAGAYAPGTKYSKVYGVCNYFFTFTVSPRSLADFVP
jgi:hypothetical protein